VKKSIAIGSLELGIPKTTIQNVIHKLLRLCAYKIQLKHEIKPDYRPKRFDFASLMLNKMTTMMMMMMILMKLLRQICFTDEATFIWMGTLTGIIAEFGVSISTERQVEHISKRTKVR
jgi:hypothetical protein